MIILFAVSALTGLAMFAKSLLIGTNVPKIFDICKALTIYFQQIMSFGYIFAKNSDFNSIILNLFHEINILTKGLSSGSYQLFTLSVPSFA